MADEVIEFIRRRFPTDNNWCTGNCYWFARILKERFPQFEIYLFPIENHFMIGNGERYYDWQGVRLKSECTEEPLLWKEVRDFDGLYYSRIIRDCIN